MKDPNLDDPAYALVHGKPSKPPDRPWPEWRLYVNMLVIAGSVARLSWKFDPILLGFTVLAGMVLIHGYVKNFRGYQG